MFALPNQSVHGKYNLISVWINKIRKRFLCEISQILSNQIEISAYLHCTEIDEGQYCDEGFKEVHSTVMFERFKDETLNWALIIVVFQIWITKLAKIKNKR